MNRLYALIWVVVLVMPAFGQGLWVDGQHPGMNTNPRICQLEDWLRQHGDGVEFYQSNDVVYDDEITYRWKAFYDVLAPIHRMLLTAGRANNLNDEEVQQTYLKIDSVHAATRRQLDEVLDTIRTAFGCLGREAKESYLYEYHKDGADTINYSIAFRNRKGILDYSRFGHAMQFWVPREVASFSYVSRKEDIWYPSNPDTKLKRVLVDHRTYGNYSHVYDEPRGIADDELRPFDIAAFEAHIQPALETLKAVKGAKAWPVYWEHDEDYEAGIRYDDPLLWKSQPLHEKHAGLTTGTHYFVPARYEAEIATLRHQLDSLALDYVNRHREQPYNYTFIPATMGLDSGGHIFNIYGQPFSGDIVEGPSFNGSNSYNLRCYRDDDGFHVLSVTTAGDLWIPKGWQKMKRWVNGKATYRRK